MVLKVLILELALEVSLVALDLLYMLLVKLDSLHFEVFKSDLSLPLRLGECVSFVAGHEKLHFQGLLGLVLSGTEDFLIADLALTHFEGLLIQVSLTVFDSLPCFSLTYLELPELILLQIL